MGSKILFSPHLPSTNTYASQLLRETKLPEGTTIYTDYQTSGKGYFGNKWESEKGKNLLVSIILYPSFIRPEDQFRISMMVSLGICDFLEKMQISPMIKWPNDIYVNNDKIAGILIDSALSGDRIEYTVVGIGLNINQDKFSENVTNPASMYLSTGRNYNVTDCLNALLAQLDGRYKQLIDNKTRSLKKEYLSKLFRNNVWSKFMDINGSFTGRIKDVADSGRLIIEKRIVGETQNIESLQEEYSFKEVEFIL